MLPLVPDKDGQTIDLESEEIEVDKEKTYQKVEALYEYVVGTSTHSDGQVEIIGMKKRNQE